MMTKNEALQGFREVYLPEIRKTERKNAGDTPRRSYVDEVMRREEWNNYVDSLQKDGQVTRWQADNWTNPF